MRVINKAGEGDTEKLEKEESEAKVKNEAERKIKTKKFEEEEEEEPFFVKISWILSFFLLILADIFDVVIDFIGLLTAGFLSFLSFITLIFQVPGGFLFLYLIYYYTKNGYLSIPEGSVYASLVLIEFFGFIPIVGSLIDILPLNTISTLTSRFRLWRIKRLKEVRKRLSSES